jgi:release factor glutamine methyltransferase
MFPTPSLHIPYSSFPPDVYEPSEDTFLLIDTLEREYDFLKSQDLNLILEVGSGNGFPITFLSNLVGKNVFSLATDINRTATRFTKSVSLFNGSIVDTLEGPFADMFRENIFDLIISNPPYVPSLHKNHYEKEELIDFAWKGGEDGLEFFKILVNSIHKRLKNNGIFICLLLTSAWCKFYSENFDFLSSHFKEFSVVLSRKTPLESLVAIKFIK